jgi:opacity protein-like surface antigen
MGNMHDSDVLHTPPRIPSITYLVKVLSVVLIVAVVVAVPGSDPRADSNGGTKTQWGTLKFQGMLTVPLGENQVEAWNECDIFLLDLLDFYSSIKVSTAGGVLASFEYVFARRYGIEVSFIYWRKMVELHFEATGITIDGSPNFVFPMLGGNYHFLKGGKIDLYAGPIVGLGLIATGWPYDNIEIKKDVALGLNAGLDYYFHSSWSVGATLKYIDFGEVQFSLFPPEFEGLICNNGLFGLGHLNVVSMTLGVGYKFQ